VHNLSLVLLLNFCAKFGLMFPDCRHKRQAVNRCLQAKMRTDQNKNSENDEIFIFCQRTFKDKIAYAQMAHLVFANAQITASKNQKSHFFCQRLPKVLK